MTRWQSLLFVPATRPDLAAKAPRCRPDAVVLDLEDAVPAHEKDRARATLTEAAAALAPAEPTVALVVRVNPPTTPWFRDDIAALPEGTDAVVIPKLESASQVAEVAAAVPGTPIVAGIETVLGVADARAVLTGAAGSMAGCYFGAEDFVADLGGVRTASNDEVAVPRAAVAMAARLAGVPALDMVTVDFGDGERFRAEARSARSLGYSGKLCIHPSQVPLANEAFLPSPEEVEWAQRLLQAFNDGHGSTIAFEGIMVDQVVATRARAILAATNGQ